MSTPDGQGRGFGDELTNFLMIALIAVFGVAAVLRAAGSIAAFLSGAAQPQVGIAGGVAMLFNPTNPTEVLQAPGLNAILYWSIAVLLLLVLGGAFGWAWVRWRRHSHNVDADPRRLAGTASSHEVVTSASAKALLRRAVTLRPSLEQPEPADVGYLLGRSHGKQVWASVEDSILLIGPPRSVSRLIVFPLCRLGRFST